MARGIFKLFFGVVCIVFIFLAMSEPVLAEAKKFKMVWRLEFWDSVYLQGGFDKKYGLEAQPVKFTSGVEAMEGVLSRSVDIGNLGDVPAISMLSKAPDFYIIGVGGWFNGAAYRMVVKKDAPYKTLADLKGKVIATKIGSGSYAVLLKMIKDKGFKDKDFQILNSTPPEIIAAMEQGSVDAALWFEPTMSLIQHKGWGKIIFDFKGYSDSYNLWMVHKKYAEKNPDTVARFMAGIMDAQYELENNQWIAAKLISDAYATRGRRVPPQVFYNGLPTIHYIPWAEDVLESLKVRWKFLVEKKKIRGKMPNWSELINLRYLKMADKIRAEKNVPISSEVTKKMLRN